MDVVSVFSFLIIIITNYKVYFLRSFPPTTNKKAFIKLIIKPSTYDIQSMDAISKKIALLVAHGNGNPSPLLRVLEELSYESFGRAFLPHLIAEDITNLRLLNGPWARSATVEHLMRGALYSRLAHGCEIKATQRYDRVRGRGVWVEALVGIDMGRWDNPHETPLEEKFPYNVRYCSIHPQVWGSTRKMCRYHSSAYQDEYAHLWDQGIPVSPREPICEDCIKLYLRKRAKALRNYRRLGAPVPEKEEDYGKAVVKPADWLDTLEESMAYFFYFREG